MRKQLSPRQRSYAVYRARLRIAAHEYGKPLFQRLKARMEATK